MSGGRVCGPDPDITGNMVDMNPPDDFLPSANPKAIPRNSSQSTALNSMALMGPTAQEDALFMQQTIWDAAMLIGLRKDGKYLLTWFQTIVILIVYAINLVVQAALVMSIAYNLASTGLHDNVKTAVVDQRLYDYQHWERIDSTEIETHSSRMCRDLVYTSMSELYNHVEAYLKEAPIFGTPWGIIVSGSAMLLFSLSMMTEFYRVLHEATHIYFLNRISPRDDSVRGNSLRNVNIIEGMSVLWKALTMVIVLLPRSCIAFGLTWFGLEFIGQTLSVEDLILNACALEVVKAVDEFLFRGLVSAKLRNLVLRTRFETFKVPKAENDTRFRWKGVSYKDVISTVSRFTFLGLWLGFSYALVLAPFHSRVQEFEVAMCGHNIDTAWQAHPLVGMPFFTTVSLTTDVDNPAEAALTEQFACFSAAGADMIRIRAGFDPKVANPSETLKDKIRGSGPVCQGSSSGLGECPNLEMSVINLLDAQTAEDLFAEASCTNLDTHMAMVADTCTQESFSRYVPWFAGVKECDDVRDLCECELRDPKGFCSYTNTTRLKAEYDISSQWVEILQFLCPQSCDTCQDTSARRLSSADGEKAAVEPQPKPRSLTRKPLNLPLGRTRVDKAVHKAPASRSPAWANEVEARLATLEQRNVELERRNTALEQRNLLLEQRSSRLDSLEQRLAAMEAIRGVA